MRPALDNTEQATMARELHVCLVTWWQQCLLACLLVLLKKAARLNFGVLERRLPHPAGSQAAAASINTLTRTLLCSTAGTQSSSRCTVGQVAQTLSDIQAVHLTCMLHMQQT